MLTGNCSAVYMTLTTASMAGYYYRSASRCYCEEQGCKHGDEAISQEKERLLHYARNEENDGCADYAKSILKAIDELLEIKSADITQEIIQIRLNLDVELRMYEIKIFMN